MDRDKLLDFLVKFQHQLDDLKEALSARSPSLSATQANSVVVAPLEDEGDEKKVTDSTLDSKLVADTSSSVINPNVPPTKISVGNSLNSFEFTSLKASTGCIRALDIPLEIKCVVVERSKNTVAKVFDKSPQWEKLYLVSAISLFPPSMLSDSPITSNVLSTIAGNSQCILQFSVRELNTMFFRLNNRMEYLKFETNEIASSWFNSFLKTNGIHRGMLIRPNRVTYFPFDPGLYVLTSTRNELNEANFGDIHKEDARVLTKSPHQNGTPVSKSGLDIKVVAYTLESTFAVSQTAEESALYVQIDLRGEKFPIGRVLSMPISVALDDYIIDTSCWYISAISFYCASTKWKADLETLVDMYLAVTFTDLDNVDTFFTAHYIWSHLPFDPGVKIYLVTPAGLAIVLYVWNPGIKFKTLTLAGFIRYTASSSMTCVWDPGDEQHDIFGLICYSRLLLTVINDNDNK